MGSYTTRQRVAAALCYLLLSAVAVQHTARAESFSVLSQNMNRLFDDINDGNQEEILSPELFQKRVSSAVGKFAGEFSLPQVIALQEVENRNVLQHIANGLRRRYAVDYRSVLVPGQDVSSINLAYLVQSSVTIRRTQQLFRAQRFADSPLFSRPPLLLEACYREHCTTMVNLHLRSMRGIDNASQTERVTRKRRQQAEVIATWTNKFQQANPDAWLMLLGDFNALTPADEHVDVAGIVRGSPDNSRVRLPSQDLVDPDLVDLTQRIPPGQRYSFIFRQRKQQLDYVFVNQPLAKLAEGIRFGAIDYAFSDHAGLLAWFRWN